MTQGIVVMMVDGSETTVLGVVGDSVADALEVAQANGLMYLDGEMHTDIEEQLEEFVANGTAAIGEITPLDDSFDVQFESGFGSWDYRFVKTKVNLG